MNNPSSALVHTNQSMLNLGQLQQLQQGQHQSSQYVQQHSLGNQQQQQSQYQTSSNLIQQSSNTGQQGEKPQPHSSSSRSGQALGYFHSISLSRNDELSPSSLGHDSMVDDLYSENIQDSDLQQQAAQGRTIVDIHQLNIKLAAFPRKTCPCSEILCVDDDIFNLKAITSKL